MMAAAQLARRLAYPLHFHVFAGRALGRVRPQLASATGVGLYILEQDPADPRPQFRIMAQIQPLMTMALCPAYCAVQESMATFRRTSYLLPD
jgi:hypothetical protein